MSWFREWLTDDGPDRASSGGPEGRERPDRPARPARDVAGAGPNGRPSSVRGATRADEPDDGHPGRDLGLPESGPGSVASAPMRLGQFLLDLLVGGLVASAFTFPAPPTLSLVIWAVLVTVPVALIGQTPAMVVTGMRVVRVDGAERVGLWALARTVSLFFVLPAAFMDKDARGLHDRVSRTVVVRTR